MTEYEYVNTSMTNFKKYHCYKFDIEKLQLKRYVTKTCKYKLNMTRLRNVYFTIDCNHHQGGFLVCHFEKQLLLLGLFLIDF